MRERDRVSERVSQSERERVSENIVFVCVEGE